MELWPSMSGMQKLLSPHFHFAIYGQTEVAGQKVVCLVYTHLFLQSHIFCAWGRMAWHFCFAYFLYYPSKHMWIAPLVEELKKQMAQSSRTVKF